MKDRHAFATVEFEDGRIETGVYAEMFWKGGHAIALITESETFEIESSGVGTLGRDWSAYAPPRVDLTA